jgi:hypothetical protein
MRKLSYLYLCLLALVPPVQARVVAPLVQYTPGVAAIDQAFTLALPAEVQAELDAIDALILQELQAEANGRIMQWVGAHHAELTLPIGEAMLSRYVIEADADPVATLQQLGQLQLMLTEQQREELAPIILQLTSKYGLSVIDELIAAGRQAEANVKILQWLYLHVEELTVQLGAAMLSRFDLAAAADPVDAMQRVAALGDMLSPEQQVELLPLMQQIKTKYDLLKDETDPEILVGVPAHAIPVVGVDYVTVGAVGVGTNGIRVVLLDPTVIDSVRYDQIVLDPTVIDSIQYDQLVPHWIKVGARAIAVVDTGTTVIPILEYGVLQVVSTRIRDSLPALPEGVLVLVDIDGARVPVIRVDGVTLLLTRPDGTVVDWSAVPANSVLAVVINGIPVPVVAFEMLDELDLTELKTTTGLIGGNKNAYDLARVILQSDTLPQPHPNAPLGFKWRALADTRRAAGPDWYNDPELLQEWTDFWQRVSRALARRNRAQGRVQALRNRGRIRMPR